MRIPCLSVQQPWAAMIFTAGEKPVENREWTWMKDRDWLAEGSVLLGIHASTRRDVWSELSADERDEYTPGWRAASCPQFGSLLGVVDLVGIYRPRDLPADLRRHECVNRDADNWCWVLDNPRKLTVPIRATGQARLFYVEVADALVPT